jgi:hypothetical protein
LQNNRAFYLFFAAMVSARSCTFWGTPASADVDVYDERSYMITFYRSLVGSCIATVLTLSATNAEANHEDHLYVTLIGHGTLLPAYASIIHYGSYSDRRMHAGWLVPNVITSVLGTSVGVYGFLVAKHPYYPTNYLSYLAGLSVIGGSAFVLGASIYQRRRPAAPDDAKTTAKIPVFLLPSMSVTRERGTTIEFTAVGTF